MDRIFDQLAFGPVISQFDFDLAISKKKKKKIQAMGTFLTVLQENSIDVTASENDPPTQYSYAGDLYRYCPAEVNPPWRPQRRPYNWTDHTTAHSRE
jgi:hypothetical protein